MVAVGEKVADFVLKDQNAQDFKLSESSGKKVLLSFHPLAWTSVCANQMKSLEANLAAFKKSNTVAVGISVDSIPCKDAWAKSLKIEKTPLLCDFWPHGGLARTLGIFRETGGTSERANILLDEQGKVIFIKVYPIKELPDIDEILAIISG